MGWQIALASMCFLPWLAACDLQLTQVLPPSELETSERGAFTSAGRFYVIGTRAADRSDAGSWIVEITRRSDGGYAATNYVAGTLEGTVEGAVGSAPAGDACLFSGMTVRGMSLYAACYAPDGRAALLEVNTDTDTVRAGYFSSCNAEPASSPCTYPAFYPNGMAVDAAGNVYLSNMISHIYPSGDTIAISVEGQGSLVQARLDPAASGPGKLSFTHRTWFSADILADGFTPNGIQIEGSVLYYAAGANINRVDIRPDGSAGAAALHYRGPALSYIDDFAVHDGQMVLGRTLPPALVALDRAPAFDTAPELGTYAMATDAIPSSVNYQADVPTGNPLFPLGSVAVTCFFGGGLYVLSAQP